MNLQVDITGTDELLSKAFFPTNDFLNDAKDASEDFILYGSEQELYSVLQNLYQNLNFVSSRYILPEFTEKCFFHYCSYRMISHIIEEVDKCRESLGEQFPALKIAFSFDDDNKLLDYLADHTEGPLTLVGVSIVEIGLDISDVIADYNLVCELMGCVNESFDMEAIRLLGERFLRGNGVRQNKELGEWYLRILNG